MAQSFSAQHYIPVAQLDTDRRAAFISRTYGHLAVAIGVFTTIEIGLFISGAAESLANWMLGFPWLLILGAFMIAAMMATKAAHRIDNPQIQYAGLFGYVIAEAILFVPLLWTADTYAPGAISSAAVVTILGFAGLTGVAFITRKDFSFLRRWIMWGGIVAILLIVGSLLFGFQLGTFFSVAMVGLAGAAILHTTSRMIHSYPEHAHVGAALELFASVALLFWYVLSIFISRR